MAGRSREPGKTVTCMVLSIPDAFKKVRAVLEYRAPPSQAITHWGLASRETIGSLPARHPAGEL
jgi:hypothetical protein